MQIRRKGKNMAELVRIVVAKGGRIEGKFVDKDGHEVCPVAYQVSGNKVYLQFNRNWGYQSLSDALQGEEKNLKKPFWNSTEATGAGRSANNIGGDWKLYERVVFGSQSLKELIGLEKKGLLA